jgi:hypothetical protein
MAEGHARAEQTPVISPDRAAIVGAEPDAEPESRSARLLEDERPERLDRLAFPDERPEPDDPRLGV